MQYEGQVPPLEGAPPTYADPTMIPERRSSWPTVVGTVSIVLGALGILMYGCCGTFGTILGPTMVGMAPPGEIDPVTMAQMDVIKRYMVFSVAANVFAAGLSVLLLVTGIGAVRRRTWSAKSHVGWAIARLLFIIPHNALSYFMNKEMFEAMQKAASDSGSPMTPGLNTIMASLGVVGIIIGVAWAAIWPVFILIWYSRGKIKDEVGIWAAEERARV